jgi:hypothetical protein
MRDERADSPRIGILADVTHRGRGADLRVRSDRQLWIRAATLEDPVYPVVYLLGWLAPLAALVYLVRELATAFNERGRVKTNDQPR